MLEVDFLAAAPGGVGGFEEVLGADYLAFEESGEGGMVVGEALDAEVAREGGGGHVDVFDFDLDVVDLAVGLLGSAEFAAWLEEGRGGVVRELGVRVRR